MMIESETNKYWDGGFAYWSFGLVRTMHILGLADWDDMHSARYLYYCQNLTSGQVIKK